MEEINVGEYVRSKYQGIFIISHINVDFDDGDYKKVCICQNEKVAFTSIDVIKQLKHSFNIIDLLEVGDIVKVLDDGLIRILHAYDEEMLEAIKEDINAEDLKLLSVATKKSFASIEFNVED